MHVSHVAEWAHRRSGRPPAEVAEMAAEFAAVRAES